MADPDTTVMKGKTMTPRTALAGMALTVLLVSGCAGPDAGEEATSPVSVEISAPDSISATPNSSASASASASGSASASASASDGAFDGTGVQSTAPEGVTARQWAIDTYQAALIVEKFIHAKYSSYDGDYSRWMKNAAIYSTDNQIANDTAYATTRDSIQFTEWIEEDGVTCEGVSWPNQSWVDPLKETTADSFTIIIPMRIECFWPSMSDYEVHEKTVLYSTSWGLGGLNVNDYSYTVVRSGDSWLVDNEDTEEPGLAD
ncbi:hypothetical protein [Changpingibacter yushuensis]|uniref:hypothetical protein n=1 Tax=Changpingibacter yushuensis TaxID=2758440 RepID=UPI0015F3C489|nr:hypothetical protein [Changpingibacter yushuensis]